MMKNILFAVFIFVFSICIGIQPIQAQTVQNTPEDQIPLTIETANKANDHQSQSGKLVLTLALLAGMLGAGYYFIRRYSFSNKISKSNLQIKVLTTHHLGPKKSLAVIRVAGESILIGVTDHNVSMIKSLSLIDDEIPVDVAPASFDLALKGENKSAMIESLEEDVEDDFSFSGIRSTVSQKLKSMRNIQ